MVLLLSLEVLLELCLGSSKVGCILLVPVAQRLFKVFFALCKHLFVVVFKGA